MSLSFIYCQFISRIHATFFLFLLNNSNWEEKDFIISTSFEAAKTADHLMATRRRHVFPGKEKVSSSPQTGTSKLKGAVNKITKTNVSTGPKKQTKPTTKITATDVSKQQIRKPASPATANKPAQPRTKPFINKTVASPKSAPKSRIASLAAAPSRSSSLPTPKPVTGRSLKAVIKDEGKQRLSQPAINARRGSVSLKKKETGTKTSATKEQPEINYFTIDKVEDLSMYCDPEPEIQFRDIDAYLAQAEEKMMHSLSSIVKESTDVLVTEIDQEPLYFAKVGQEIDPADSYPDIKIQVFENKYDREESIRKQELEHTERTNSCDRVEKLAGNSHDVAEELAVKVDESKEIIRPAEEKKKEISFPPKQQERTHGKFDSPLSNNVIEETSNKLREQRINRVKALAGAFETVISLQEK